MRRIKDHDDLTLSSHAFSKYIMESVKPILERAVPRMQRALARTGKHRSDEEADLSDPEQYHFNVFSRLSPITTAFERFSQVQLFLKSFPRPKTYRSAGISQDKWLEYHYGVYIVTVVSLADLALLLTNAVFRTVPDTLLGSRAFACA
jgi:hypothetical protein